MLHFLVFPFICLQSAGLSYLLPGLNLSHMPIFRQLWTVHIQSYLSSKLQNLMSKYLLETSICMSHKHLKIKISEVQPCHFTLFLLKTTQPVWFIYISVNGITTHLHGKVRTLSICSDCSLSHLLYEICCQDCCSLKGLLISFHFLVILPLSLLSPYVLFTTAFS